MLNQLKICIKGAGEIASGIAWRLHRAHLEHIVMLEVPQPLAVRRQISFCEAVANGSQQVEGVDALRVASLADIIHAWDQSRIAVRVDPQWRTLVECDWNITIDAILAKRNSGTTIDEAPLVIGVGPGFWAGRDVHLVIETNRGHNLGRIIEHGSAIANTGVPGAINGYALERVLRAPTNGRIQCHCFIGDLVKSGCIVATVNDQSVRAEIDGVLRGLIKSGTQVKKGMKIGDIDPRGDKSYCNTISDKARAIAGAVLESILRKYNQ